MKEYTAYFPHDVNARRDPKLVELRHRLGLGAKEIYWDTLEYLAESQDDFPAIRKNSAKIWCQNAGISEKKWKKFLSVALDLELFQQDERGIFSESLNKRIEKMNEIRRKRREAACKRYANAGANA